MSDLLAAVPDGHVAGIPIIFAVVGIGMPVLMVIGAVSGTVSVGSF